MWESLQLSVYARTSAVTDLHEDSRYPSLAWSVFLPILLFIVYKKKNKPQIISLCAWASIYQIYPPPYSPSIPYGASQRPRPFHEGSLGAGKGWRATFNWATHITGWGVGSGEWETHHDLQLQKNIEFGSAENAPHVWSQAKAVWLLRPLGALCSEGSKILSWERT